MTKTTVRRKATHRAIRFSAMRDARLSIEARGLLALLLTHSEAWEFNRKDIMNKCGCGQAKYDRIRRELVDLNYLKIDSERNDKGQIIGWSWELDDDPEGPLKSTKSGENQNTENAGSGKQGCIRVTSNEVKNIQGRKSANRENSSPSVSPDKPSTSRSQDDDLKASNDGTEGTKMVGMKWWKPFAEAIGREAGPHVLSGLGDVRQCADMARRYEVAPETVAGAVLAFYRDPKIKEQSFKPKVSTALSDERFSGYLSDPADPITAKNIKFYDPIAEQEKQMRAYLDAQTQEEVA
jgi:hypothetical protein